MAILFLIIGLIVIIILIFHILIEVNKLEKSCTSFVELVRKRYEPERNEKSD